MVPKDDRQSASRNAAAAGTGVDTAKASHDGINPLGRAEWLASIINSANDGVITVDESQRIVLFNHAAELMFQCFAAEAIGRPIEQFIPGEFSRLGGGPNSGLCETGAAGPAGELAEVRGRRTDGNEFLIEASISQVLTGGRTLFTVILRDVTDRKSREDALRGLSGQLISVQEEERRRIARELHDDLNQRMAILSIELQQLDQSIPKGQDKLHTTVQHLWERAQDICSEIHRLSHEMHSSKVDHLGLVAALKDYFGELWVHHGMAVDFRHHGFPAELSTDVRLCLFRVAQESLRNIIEHSGARTASLIVEKTDGAVHLTVTDEGCGFDEKAVRTKGGLGLVSMAERLRLVGGEFSIHSWPSRGTQIRVSVPLTDTASLLPMPQSANLKMKGYPYRAAP